MLRAFKSVDEFERVTNHTIGDAIQLKTKETGKVFVHGLINAFYPEDNVVSIGITTMSFQELCDSYLFLDIYGNWQPCGIEVSEEKKKPAKFQVGKKYFFFNGRYQEKVFINAKYKDPEDKKLTMIVDSVVVRLVNVDKDGNESFKYREYEVKAEDEVKEYEAW